MKSVVNIYGGIVIIMGITGLAINRRNILKIVIIIEMIVFASCIILIVTSIENNDQSPLIAAMYIIAISGSELAIGLTIIIRYYRIKKKSIN